MAASVSTVSDTGQIVLDGLFSANKHLPAFLLYDDRGSELFEEITRLPEYYLTRAERSILLARGAAIAERACALAGEKLHVLELGAGTATKSQILLRALAKRQGRSLYVPSDLCSASLHEAEERIAREEREIEVRPLVADHEQALRRARELSGPLFVWFLGSSLGNYESHEALALLTSVREALGERGLFLLGTDMRKSAELLVPAYDDARGVTANFNKNLLLRINRELGGHFEPNQFRHVALWNDEASSMEMYLESTREQDVAIDALDLEVHFCAGERIHTESSHKYDEAELDGFFQRAGLRRDHTYRDAQSLFGVHLVRSAAQR